MARAIGLASALRVHRRVGRRAKAGGVASPAPERSNTATPGTLSLSLGAAAASPKELSVEHVAHGDKWAWTRRIRVYRRRTL
jgi:hypothetical protein